MYGGSSSVHRAHGAAFVIQFEAMRWAREAGSRVYDLWGIPAEDPQPSEGAVDHVSGSKGDDWRGLYKFKTGFGGEIVAYPSSLERRYHPVLGFVARRASSLIG
jgi:lipid II:glycine glycyltransferase (peptidoglycan interpeptide bridge formation enzyme)